MAKGLGAYLLSIIEGQMEHVWKLGLYWGF